MSTQPRTAVDCERASESLTSLAIRRKSKSSPYFRTTAGFAGLQFIFTTFIGHGVTHLESLGLSQIEIAITLLAGPICGAIFQPYFGSWSDQFRSSWGRRKPFIIIGTVVLILAILSIAWADSIAHILTSSSTNETYRIVLVILTLFSTFSLWIAAQAVQVGMRALIADGCTPTEQVKASAWAGCYSNLAAALGNLQAYMDGSRTQKSGEGVFKSMSVLAACCLAFTILVSCFTATEQTPTASNRITAQHISFRAVWKLLFHTSPQIRSVCLVQFFAWGGWFPFLFYTKKYVNSIHKDELYREEFAVNTSTADSRMGSLTLLVYTTLSFFMGVLLPYLISRNKSLSIRRLWIASLGLFGIAMLGTFVIFSTIGTIVLFGTVGFSWAASAWIPYALLGAEASQLPEQCDRSESSSEYNENELNEKENADDENDMSNQLGLIYGVHNLSICLPQILICLGMGLALIVSDMKSDNGNEQSFNPVWILRLGGVFALIAMYIAAGVEEPFKEGFSGEYREVNQEDR